MNKETILFICNAGFAFINICTMVYLLANLAYWDKKIDHFLKEIKK